MIPRQHHRYGASSAPAQDAPAPPHALHLYEDDAQLVEALGTFVADGLDAGDAVVLVATHEHVRDLERELAARGIDLGAHRARGRAVTLDAAETVARLVPGGVPDAARFRELIEPLLEAARAAAPSSRVRIHGEMVDLLWREGNAEATLRLEALWSEVVTGRPYSLLCTYPLGAFSAAEGGVAFRGICEQHGAVAPAGATASPPADPRLGRVAELEQRAHALEREIERRRQVEAERARLLEAESRARAEMTLLFRLTDTVNRAETLEQIFESALDGIATALGVSRASILLFDSDGVLRFKAWRGLSDAYRAAVEGHTPWDPVAKDPPPVLVEDVREDPRVRALLPVLEREGIGALGFFPLFSRGRLKGKFMVYYPGPHPFTEEEQRVASAVAGEIAFAISRSLAMRERERLLGIVGHDLRNPLNAVTMAAAALLRRDLDDASAKLARRIVASAQRMERLIALLLDFAQARQQGSQLPIHRRRVDLADLARRVVEEIEAGHPKASLALSVGGDCRGEWDADRLAQVLSNLVANAIHHGAGSPIAVRVRGDGDAVVVEVSNGGPPIPPAVLPEIFDPFRRGPSARGDRNGLGLGLFISRELVRAHGGSIRARSTAAEGTTFTARLPRGAGGT